MQHRHLISRQGSDRATAYQMSRRFVRWDDTLFIGWLDGPEAPGRPVRAMLGICDGETGELQASMLLGKAVDNHCGPALAMDPDGRLHVLVGGHGTPFQYRWSDDPTNLSSWSAPEELPASSTYPSLLADASGTLHLAYRQGGRYSQLRYRRKFPGQPWGEPVPLALSPKPGYAHFMQTLSLGPEGKLHLTCQFHYGDTGPSYDAWTHAGAYLFSDDGGDTWYNEGQRCRDPLTMETVRPFARFGRGEQNGGGLGNHVIGADGQPRVFCSLPDTAAGALYRRCPHGEWERHELSDKLGGLQIWHGGSSSLSRAADGDLHLVFFADPKGGPWIWSGAGMALYRARFSPTCALLDIDPITAAEPGFAHWLPALETWDWQRPEITFADGHWLMHTRAPGLKAHVINRNTIETEVWLGKLTP